MATAQKLMTADEFMLLPDPEEGGKLELVRGEVVHMTPVGPEHGMRASEIDYFLRSFIRTNALGQVFVETGYRLSRDPDIVRAPDVSYVAAQRLPAGGFPRGYFDLVPDLAVEVVSPDDTDREVHAKVGEYLDAGVARVWVVRPELRTITVHRERGLSQTLQRGDTLTSDDAAFALDGFTLPLATLFA